jgi:hypothetical protein
MSDTIESAVESLKELNDLEFELLFIDGIYKKLKSLDRNDIRTETMLFMYMSVVESLKKYKLLVKEGGREILHKDVVDLLISKGEFYLTGVANDESRAPYVQQSVNDLKEIAKELLFTLKKELVEDPKYANLSPL